MAPSLTTVTKKEQGSFRWRSYTSLGGIHVPADLEVSALGSKFRLQPTLQPPDLLALTRKVAYKVNENVRPRCTYECVDALDGTNIHLKHTYDHPRSLIFILVDHNLRVLEADNKDPLY